MPSQKNVTTTTNDDDVSSTSPTPSPQPARRPLRVACLLPSTTEICGALGLASNVTGVTHECDVLHDVPNPFVVYDRDRTLARSIAEGRIQVLTSSEIDPHTTDQGDIHAMVSRSLRGGRVSLYWIDGEAMTRADPDVVITQALCEVCAPSADQVRGVVCSLGDEGGGEKREVKVINLEPTTIGEVADTFVTVASACGVEERGVQLRDEFLNNFLIIRATVDECLRSDGALNGIEGDRDGEGVEHSSGLPPPAAPRGSGGRRIQRPRVLMLEWLDPPFDGGHWVPGMIDFAGCVSALHRDAAAATNSKGSEPPVSVEGGDESSSFDGNNNRWKSRKSRRITWDEIRASDPDVVLVACCGFDLDRNVSDAQRAVGKLSKLRAYREGRIYACDGNRYFARPGPSLVGGAAIVARVAFEGEGQITRRIDELPFAPGEGVGWARVNFGSSSSSPRTDGGCTDRGGLKDVEDLVIGDDGAANDHDGDSDGGGRDFHSLHAEACANGETFYDDPETGYKVFTEVAHRRRGRCCGSGCRHCPYSHENVKGEDRARRIMQPAFLHEESDPFTPFSLSDEYDETAGGDDGADSCGGGKNRRRKKKRGVKVLFFSGGKDSFLALRALVAGGVDGGSTPPFTIVLLTTFDATSRVIAHQEVPIDVVVKQARHLRLSLVGVPVHRGTSEGYVERIRRAIDVISTRCGGGGGSGGEKGRAVSSLAFGDLHLEHVRHWRDSELGRLGIDLEYPLWKIPYSDLLRDLERSAVRCIISASTIPGVEVGAVFDGELSRRMEEDLGLDGFGENGEIHSVAEVWHVDGRRALGLTG